MFSNQERPRTGLGDFAYVDKAADPAALREYLLLMSKNPDVQARRQEGLRLLKPSPGDRILDLGCGNGEMAVEIAARYPQVTRVVGVDNSMREITHAVNNLQNAPAELRSKVSFLVGDGVNLPFKEGTFSKTMEERMLQHVGDPYGVLREMVFATEKGGMVMSTNPNWQAVVIIGEYGLRIPEVRIALCATIQNDGMGAQLASMFADAGLSLVEGHITTATLIGFDQINTAFRLEHAFANAQEQGILTGEQVQRAKENLTRNPQLLQATMQVVRVTGIK